MFESSKQKFGLLNVVAMSSIGSNAAIELFYELHDKTTMADPGENK